MRRHEARLSRDAELLNRYLYKYKNCIKRKHSLEKRRNDILREFNYLPVEECEGGNRQQDRDKTRHTAISFRLDEIELRINEQIEKSIKALSNIMEIIDYLPENSIERTILEHRYIDKYSWEKIVKVEHISKTPAIQHWRKGLYMLLEFKKVNVILKEFDEKQSGK